MGGSFFGGFPPNFRGGSSKFLGGGFLQIFGGCLFGGVPPNFRGVSFGGVPPIFQGVPPIFRGVSFFLEGGSSKFSGGVLPRNTVNVQPVRILLECILVLDDFHLITCFNYFQIFI